MTKLPITNIHRTDLKAAKDLGLFDPMDSPSRDVLQAKIKQYNDSLLPDPIEDEPIELEETIIYKSSDIASAREALVKQSLEPVELSALERAMEVLKTQNPSLSKALWEEFQSQGKKVSKGKKEPIDKSIRLASLIEKHKAIYDEVNDLIAAGKKKSHAHMSAALNNETSQGAIAFYWVAYHLYQKYPDIYKAVNAGLYPLSSLCKDGTKSDRSDIISTKLGVTLVITLD